MVTIQSHLRSVCEVQATQGAPSASLSFLYYKIIVWHDTQCSVCIQFYDSMFFWNQPDTCKIKFYVGEF